MGEPSPPTLAQLTAGVCAFMLAAGCGGSSTAATAGAPFSGPASPGAPGLLVPRPAAPAWTTLPHAPTAAPVELDVEVVAARYLAARENAISYRHPSTRAWLSEIRPVMTLAGWQRLSASLGDSGGFPATTARQRQWSVRAAVACRHNPDAAIATSTQATLICTVTDRTIDAGGIQVAPNDLPGVWPYNRSQPPALLSMRKVDGQWLVDTDETGQAG